MWGEAERPATMASGRVTRALGYEQESYCDSHIDSLVLVAAGCRPDRDAAFLGNFDAQLDVEAA